MSGFRPGAEDRGIIFAQRGIPAQEGTAVPLEILLSHVKWQHFHESLTACNICADQVPRSHFRNKFLFTIGERKFQVLLFLLLAVSCLRKEID